MDDIRDLARRWRETLDRYAGELCAEVASTQEGGRYLALMAAGKKFRAMLELRPPAEYLEQFTSAGVACGLKKAEADNAARRSLGMRRPGLKHKNGGCYVCGVSARLDGHHLAPKAVFGDAADRWPVVDVCHDCHREWHRLMTDHWMIAKRDRGTE